MPMELFKHTREAEEAKPGDVLFRQGEHGDAMYVVIEGFVDIDHDGRVIETIGEGGIVGELALVDDAPRSASAVVASPSRILTVDKDRFTFLVQEHPTFALQVMRQMAERLRNANQATPRDDRQA
jgi:CRP-like cAMP-binding protein